MKVLLYIKRSVQDKDGFSPLMSRISVRGKVNSIAQFACKFKIDVRLWNATAQRCTGKSKAATMANREIDRLLLLLQKRFNELTDIKDVVKAEEVRNVFQGLAETQDTIMKLYAEHNSDYALRVRVIRPRKRDTMCRICLSSSWMKTLSRRLICICARQGVSCPGPYSDILTA